MTLAVAQCLWKFFNSFDIPGYEENAVPDDAELPYITYTLSAPDWTDTASITASIWYAGTTLDVVAKKTDEIEKRIDNEPRVPAKNGGCIYLYKGNPFSQRVPTENGNLTVITLNIGFHALCK